MPTITRPRPNETREMRLFSKIIELDRLLDGHTAQSDSKLDDSLPQFIARRRAPGDGWHSWDEIRYELTGISGEIVSDGTIRKWAKRYGIPEGTALAGGPVTAEEFAAALKKADIDL